MWFASPGLRVPVSPRQPPTGDAPSPSSRPLPSPLASPLPCPLPCPQVRAEIKRASADLDALHEALPPVGISLGLVQVSQPRPAKGGAASPCLVLGAVCTGSGNVRHHSPPSPTHTHSEPLPCPLFQVNMAKTRELLVKKQEKLVALLKVRGARVVCSAAAGSWQLAGSSLYLVAGRTHWSQAAALGAGSWTVGHGHGAWCSGPGGGGGAHSHWGLFGRGVQEAGQPYHY